MSERTCEYCGDPLTPRQDRFCCPAHRSAHWRATHQGPGMPGRVAGVRRLKSGDWSVTVHVAEDHRTRVAELAHGNPVRVLDGGNDPEEQP